MINIYIYIYIIMTKVIIIIVSKLSPASTPFRLGDRHPSRPLPQEERPSALQCANNDHSSPTGQKRVKFSASDGELGVGRGVGVGGAQVVKEQDILNSELQRCSHFVVLCNAARLRPQGRGGERNYGFQSVTLLPAVFNIWQVTPECATKK